MNHKGTVLLETDRLILRPFVSEDAEAVFNNWANDDEVTKYLTWPTHQSVEQTKEFMNFCLSCYEQPDGYQWGIELKDTHELIGNISVVRINEAVDAASLGWVLGRKWWGQEIMPEAAEKVISYLFREVGAKRIDAEHDVNNPKSGRVMEKVGMKYEGTFRQFARNNQGIVDCAIYSVLSAEQ